MKRNKNKYNKYSKKYDKKVSGGSKYFTTAYWLGTTPTNLPDDQQITSLNQPLTEAKKNEYRLKIAAFNVDNPEDYYKCNLFPTNNKDKQRFLDYASKTQYKDAVLNYDSACKTIETNPSIQKIKNRLISEIDKLNKKNNMLSEDLATENEEVAKFQKKYQDQLQFLKEKGHLVEGEITLQDPLNLSTQDDDYDIQKEDNNHETGGRKRKTRKRQRQRYSKIKR